MTTLDRGLAVLAGATVPAPTHTSLGDKVGVVWTEAELHDRANALEHQIDAMGDVINEDLKEIRHAVESYRKHPTYRGALGQVYGMIESDMDEGRAAGALDGAEGGDGRYKKVSDPWNEGYWSAWNKAAKKAGEGYTLMRGTGADGNGAEIIHRDRPVTADEKARQAFAMDEWIPFVNEWNEFASKGFSGYNEDRLRWYDDRYTAARAHYEKLPGSKPLAPPYPKFEPAKPWEGLVTAAKWIGGGAAVLGAAYLAWRFIPRGARPAAAAPPRATPDLVPQHVPA